MGTAAAVAEKRFGKAKDPFGSLLEIKLDRRREKRVRTNRKAKLVFGADWAFARDCTICDLSSGGAQVQLEEADAIPERVTLIDLSAWTAFEAQVRWRSQDGSLGLMFEARHDLSAPATPTLKLLRQSFLDEPAEPPVPSNSNSPQSAPAVAEPAPTMADAVAIYKCAMTAALAAKKAAKTEAALAAAEDAIRAAKDLFSQAADKALSAEAFSKIDALLGLG